MQAIASALSATLPVETQVQATSKPAVPAPAPQVKAPASTSRTAPSDADVKRAIEAANTALKHVSSDLEFAVDSATGTTVLKVIDASTQQVIRQFPSEEMLAIARAIDRFQGLLIKEKA